MTKALFDFLCGIGSLEVSGTGLAFEGLVIKKYKDSGECLVDIDRVPTGIKGSIDVLAFVGADLTNVHLPGCDKITGKELPSTFLLRTSPRGNFPECSANISAFFTIPLRRPWRARGPAAAHERRPLRLRTNHR